MQVLKILNEKYGVTEEDFLSAELSVVPAFDTRESALTGPLSAATGTTTGFAPTASFAPYWSRWPKENSRLPAGGQGGDRSEGVTGMKSAYFDRFVSDLCQSEGTSIYECYANSFCLSADVCNAFDPNFPEVSDKRNNAKLNYGLSILKHTGSRGKSGASDASAEIIARLRKLFSENGVVWQMGELGKVDQGGGGTVAMFTAVRNIDTIDAGVPVLSMHARPLYDVQGCEGVFQKLLITSCRSHSRLYLFKPILV